MFYEIIHKTPHQHHHHRRRQYGKWHCGAIKNVGFYFPSCFLLDRRRVFLITIRSDIIDAWWTTHSDFMDFTLICASVCDTKIDGNWFGWRWSALWICGISFQFSTNVSIIILNRSEKKNKKLYTYVIVPTKRKYLEQFKVRPCRCVVCTAEILDLLKKDCCVSQGERWKKKKMVTFTLCLTENRDKEKFTFKIMCVFGWMIDIAI